MKKILMIALAVAIGVAACKKENDKKDDPITPIPENTFDSIPENKSFQYNDTTGYHVNGAGIVHVPTFGLVKSRYIDTIGQRQVWLPTVLFSYQKTNDVMYYLRAICTVTKDSIILDNILERKPSNIEIPRAFKYVYVKKDKSIKIAMFDFDGLLYWK